jgi:hypothetical protein
MQRVERVWVRVTSQSLNLLPLDSLPRVQWSGPVSAAPVVLSLQGTAFSPLVVEKGLQGKLRRAETLGCRRRQENRAPSMPTSASSTRRNIRNDA